MPTMTMQQEIGTYGRLLETIAGPALSVTQKNDGSQMPYRWEIATATAPLQYVATIELSGPDILVMCRQREDQNKEYLQTKFAYLFNRS